MAFFRPESGLDPAAQPLSLYEKIWRDHLVESGENSDLIRVDRIHDGPGVPLAARPGEVIAHVAVDVTGHISDDVAGLAGVGAFGALAIPIDDAQAATIRAGQPLAVAPARPVRVMADGVLASYKVAGVGAVDLALSLIRDFGPGGADGLAIEFWGQALRNLTQEGRMTIAGLAVAAGADFGLVGPDERSFSYMRSRGLSQARTDRADAAARGHGLTSDRGARWAGTISLDAKEIFPMVSFGPELTSALPHVLPVAARLPDAVRGKYSLGDGARVSDIEVSRVTVGGRADGRLDDLRAAAVIVNRAGPVAKGVAARVIPADDDAASRAEAEGLDRIFTDAGFAWRAGSADHVLSAAQAEGGQIHLMSPAMAAAAAATGRITDIRKFA